MILSKNAEESCKSVDYVEENVLEIALWVSEGHSFVDIKYYLHQHLKCPKPEMRPV